MDPVPTFIPGENCWKQSSIARGGVALSGQGYFRAFREAVRSARKEVVLLAWDLCETVEMIRDPEDDDGYPSKLSDFLLAILEERSELTIHILLWDFSVIYAAEREWLPFTNLGQSKHPRLKLVTDNKLPTGASHHQKLLVVDGALAMCGGLDIAAWRWDSPSHKAADPRRKDPKDKPYQPYHDLQMVVSGPAAQTLRELANNRWERATGHKLPPLEKEESEPVWPESVPVAFEDNDVAFALTYAKYQSSPAIHQIEASYLEMIRCAEQSIYIENQYLSSQVIVDALCERLREDNGPEIILILTRKVAWAAESTMGIVRNRLLEKLREADQFDRFRCYYPSAGEGEEATQIYVHAKLMIVDHRILTHGSANLSNRSMRVDSELNLILLEAEAGLFPQKLEEQLLATHLDCETSEVGEALGANGRLIPTIDQLNGSGTNRLEPLKTACANKIERQMADSKLLDPDEPLSPVHHVWEALEAQGELYWKDKRSSSILKTIKIIGWILVLIVAGLAIAQLWDSALGQEEATSLFTSLQDHPAALPLVLLLFIAGGVIAVPINLLLIATALTFGSWVAIGCGFIGCMISGALSFGMGHYLGKPLVRRIIGERLDTIIESLRNRGVGSMVVIRVLPVAPFGLINLVAGVSGLRFRIFMLGSALGMLPGVVAVVLATTYFKRAVQEPAWDHWLPFILLAALIIGLAVWVRKRFAS